MPVPRFHSGVSFKDKEDTGLLFRMVDMHTGKPVELEVAREQLPGFVSMVFAACASLGEDHPQTTPIEDREPADAPFMSVSEFEVRSAPPNGAWLFLRHGAVDVAVAFDDRAAVAALGQQLLDESKRL